MNKLNSREHNEQKIIVVILLCIACIVWKSVYNQGHNTNQNWILIPLGLLLGIIALFKLAINAFSTGNIVRNWNSKLIFKVLERLINKNSLKTNEESSKITTKVFGYFYLVIIILMATYLIYFLLK